MILEINELLLKYYGTWCVIGQPQNTVKGGYWDFELSKVLGRNPGIWYKPDLDSLDGQNMVFLDNIALPHCTRIIEEYKNQQNIASLPRPSLLPDLNPIEHVWDKLGWRVWNRGTSRIKTIVNFARLYCRGRGQDLMPWSHVPIELNDENVPNCDSTVRRLCTTLTGSSGLLWVTSWLLAPDPESVCSKEKVLMKLQL